MTLRPNDFEIPKGLPKADARWAELESRLRSFFGGLLRKDGRTDMVEHSLAVGRGLARDGESDLVVFCGYCHDVPEDVGSFVALPRDAQDEVIYGLARQCGLDEADAHAAIRHIHACCYSQDECAMEDSIGGRAGKLARKASASARWSAAEPEVVLVKRMDILCNNADMVELSATFIDDYRAWAMPLLDALEDRISALRRARATALA